MQERILRARKIRVVVITLILLTLAFIWHNSMQSGAESASFSDLVRTFLEGLLGFPIDPFILRKLAHFSEYGLLGVEFSWLLNLRCRPDGNHSAHGRNLLDFPAIGLSAAVIDENIQVFSQRGSAVTDVLIDFAGFCTGFFGLTLLIFLARKILAQRKKTNSDV